MFWPQMLMNVMGEYPHGCELNLLTALAIQECDGHDGVIDGIISNFESCSFDPFQYVGINFTCQLEGKTMKLSRAAAVIANASWTGPTDSNGNFIWYGVNHGTDLSGDATGTGIAATACNNSVCRGIPVPFAYQWIQLWVEKNPSYNYTTITRKDYDDIMRRSATELDPIVSSSNPNLTEFYKAGGKMMTYHGQVRRQLNIQLLLSRSPLNLPLIYAVRSSDTDTSHSAVLRRYTGVCARGSGFLPFLRSTRARALLR